MEMDEKGDSSKCDISHMADTESFKMPVMAPSLVFKKKSTAAPVSKVFSDTEEKSADVCKVEDVTVDIEKKSDENNKKMDTSDTSSVQKSKSFSPAELLKETEVVIPYKEPLWGGLPETAYFFEIVKNGTVMGRVELTTKSFFVFGRLPSCDHTMDHPSLSRYHAVIQHCAVPEGNRQVGWYLCDLDSTHGTWINKNKVMPNVHHRLRVGYVVKFGGSSRLYILQGPDSDQDEEAELSVSELKAQRERQKRETEVLRQVEAMEAEATLRRKMQAEQDTGCTWGFGDDAEDANSDEESGDVVEPMPLQEELYIEDPKKALRGFFEREGWELPEYEFLDEGKGKHTCRVEIPIDTPSGQPAVAEVTQTGSRKDAVVACALEACRILDRHGLLRKATHESRAKKAKNWEEADFYDSDEDTFLDRTGDIEKKRQKRILRVKPFEKKAESFETLSKKLEEVQSELSSIEARLQQDENEKQAMEDEGIDALDAFMMSIKSGGLDTRKRLDLKRRSVELRHQQAHLERLLKIAKPCSLLTFTSVHKDQSTAGSTTATKALPIFGKIKTAAVPKPVHKEMPIGMCDKVEGDEVEEEEEEDDDANANGAVAESVEGHVIAESTKDNVVAPKPSIKSKPSATETDTAAAVPTALTVKPRSAQEKQVEKRVSTVDNKSRKRKSEEKTPMSHSQAEYNEADPDYAVWIPPKNQTGDGRTHLNEKFGY